jgi:hypothetical protein
MDLFFVLHLVVQELLYFAHGVVYDHLELFFLEGEDLGLAGEVLVVTGERFFWVVAG